MRFIRPALGFIPQTMRFIRRALGFICRALGLICRALGCICNVIGWGAPGSIGRALGCRALVCRAPGFIRRALGFICRVLGFMRPALGFICRALRFIRRALGCAVLKTKRYKRKRANNADDAYETYKKRHGALLSLCAVDAHHGKVSVSIAPSPATPRTVLFMRAV